MGLNIMAFSGLRDIPITSFEQETLEVKPYAEALAQFIMECDTPMTIAIQGDWGSGKTSMMNLVKSSIENDHPGKMCSIWFNTWQYSQFNAHDQLGLSLLSRFASEVSGKSNGTGEQVKKLLGGLARVVAKTAAFVGTMAFTGSSEGARDAQDVVEQSFSKGPIEAITELKESLIKLTNERLVNAKAERIVVFIDDLDRLVPERAVELLEVFKLFLDVPGCVFILACDYQVIAQGLQKKFGIGENDLKGKSFFDKIIQLPFSMPISQYDTRRYTSDLLEKIGIVAGGDLEKYQALISASVGLNPRSMKRLFNAFQLINLAAQNKGLLKEDATAKHGERQRILLACLCMQTAFEPVYRHFIELGGSIQPESLFELRDFDPKISEARLVKEMGGIDSTMTQRLPGFMGAFIDAIQLLSDGDDRLTPDELHNLAEILNFSSITATNAAVLTQDGGERDSQMLKDLLRRLVEQANENHEENLNKLRVSLKVGSTSRKGKVFGCIESDGKGFFVEGKRIHFHCDFNDRDDPAWAGVYLSTDRHFDWLRQIVDSEIGDAAPYRKGDRHEEEEKRTWIGYEEYGTEPLVRKLKVFEGMFLECLDIVIPRLVKLRAK